MIDPAQPICQSHLAIRQSRWYWVLGSQYDTQLAYWWQNCRFCRNLIEVQAQQILLRRHHYGQLMTAYLPISVGNDHRLADIVHPWQTLRHGLTNSWQSCSFCSHIIEVQVHLQSVSDRFGYWDTRWVIMSKLRLLLPGIWWLMIEVQGQLRSVIQHRLWFLDFYEAKFNKLQYNMDLSFQPRHASRATNKQPKRMYPRP